MKIISKFLTASFIIIIISASISAEDASPIIAGILSYASYVLVFKGMRSQAHEYDPVDYL